jgi:O-methyltransferase
LVNVKSEKEIILLEPIVTEAKMIRRNNKGLTCIPSCQILVFVSFILVYICVIRWRLESSDAAFDDNVMQEQQTKHVETKHVDGVRHHLKTFTTKELRKIAEPWTMVSDLHFKTALEAVEKVNKNKIAGDIVECGVWKGGMSMAMALVNLRSNTDRHMWLFDTFEGLPEPSSEKDDRRAKKFYKELTSGEQSAKVVRSLENRGMEEGKWNYGPIDIVKNNMYYSTYPKEKLHFVKGKVEDTLKSEPLPNKIAILRIDTDWYDSTKAELDVLWERLQPGGVLLVDDYCSWRGARNALDEFFRDKLGLDASNISKNRPCLHYWKPKEDNK